MVNTYLLTYMDKPLGLYSNMTFLFDFILEMINVPRNTLNIFKLKIFEYEINRGYPLNVFKFINTNNKLIFQEESEKRVEMNRDTFSRFIKIKYRLKHQFENKEEPIKKDKIIVSEDEIKEIHEEKKVVKDELQNTIAELNRIKNRTKKIQNWYNIFNNDIKLFDKFTKEKEDDNDFIVPEMFQPKFDFFSEKGTESFTQYFSKFNEDAELDFDEIENFLNQYEDDTSSDKCNDEDDTLSDKSNDETEEN